MMTALTDQDKMAIAAKYCEASRTNDGAAMLALSAPDAIVWHNFDGAEADMAHTVKTLAWVHRTAKDLAWKDVHLQATSTGFIWQALMTGIAPGGSLLVNTCIVVILNEHGLITRLDEYLDSTSTAVLRVRVR